tara:strand:- start:1370 stop:1651 length:282 start_codon:yes stop_codon:yes gene_type:complete
MSTYQQLATEEPVPTHEPVVADEVVADEEVANEVVEPELPYDTMMADEDIVIGEYRVKWGTIRDVLDERGLAHTDENVIGIMLHAIMARASAQ